MITATDDVVDGSTWLTINSEPAEWIDFLTSGGKDSSVGVVLTKRSGKKVRAAYLKGWGPDWTDCVDPPERRASFEVADKFGIPWRQLNYSKLFFDLVFDPMFSDYFSGITPNPDTGCNTKIKFGVFPRHAFETGATKVGSGHYVRLQERPFRVLMAKDKKKDQSYFLSGVPKEILKKCEFPMGDYIKETDTIRLAYELGIPEHIINKDSTEGICFMQKKVVDGIPYGQDITMRELLLNEGERRGIKFRPGPIVDASGRVVGEHDGVMIFAATIGQRDGLGISGSKSRMYVVKRDIANNTLVVDSEQPQSRELIVRNLNWLLDEDLSFPIRCHGKIRSTQKNPAECSVHKTGEDEIRVEFKEPQTAVAPGQACVLYDGEIMLGGGVIVS